jgi:two-component system, OmpR family, sensor kinase
LVVFTNVGIFASLSFIVQRIVRGELNPVQQLTDQLAERGAQNLTVLRANEGFPSELITIVESTNRLLERMDSALDVERSLAANAAHELRTPIATARLRIDNAMQHDLPEAAKIELVAAMAGLVQLTRRAEKLLQLSRAEGSQSLNSERMDLAHLASLVVQEFWADAGVQRRLYLDLTAMDGADIASVWVMGDMDTLALALRNLIENALRHSTDADVTLRVRRSEDGLTALASVIDQGLGLSSDQITKLSKRHVRYSTDQTGFGLGLSIVKTIVERQKGRLAFTSPPAGLTQGLEVRIELRTA